MKSRELSVVVGRKKSTGEELRKTEVQPGLGY